MSVIVASPRMARTAAEIAMEGGSARQRGVVKANWYEGSRWSPNRMYVWYPVQSANRDLDRYTRYELNRKAEYLWKNSPFIRGVIERLVTLTIGTGIYPTPKSSSKEFNAAAKKVWREFCRRPCVDGKQTMGNYQRIKARGRFKHGESFTMLTHNEYTKQDGIQGFEWSRVDMLGHPDYILNPTGTQGVKPPNNDGVDTNEQGYPLRYHVTGMDEAVPENLMVHHFSPMRDEQARGETILSVAINQAQDMKEILDFEKQAVKDASSKKDIIQTMTGDLDPESFRKLAFNNPNGGYPTTETLPADDVTKDAYYQVKFQGQPIVLKTGDKYTPYQSNRPGSAWEGFMAFLANTLVLGTGGFPPSLVLPIDIGGTDIRRDLKIGQRIVGAWQDDIANEFQYIWEYVIQGAIEDRKIRNAPEDWRENEWHFPESLTVDRAQAGIDRDDVQAGLMSWDRYHGRSGNDGDEQEQIVVNEVKRRRLRICSIPESEPFADAAEFTQFLSLSIKSSLTDRVTEDTDPSQQTPGGTKPNPTKVAKRVPVPADNN